MPNQHSTPWGPGYNGTKRRGHTHTDTWAHTRVLAPPALPDLLQSSGYTCVRAAQAADVRGGELGEAQGRRGGPRASKSGFSPVELVMGSWGTHPDIRLQPTPQLHPSSGRRGQAGLVFAFGEALHLEQKPPGLSWTSRPASSQHRHPATVVPGHFRDSLFSSARWGHRTGLGGCWCGHHVAVWTRMPVCGRT